MDNVEKNCNKVEFVELNLRKRQLNYLKKIDLQKKRDERVRFKGIKNGKVARLKGLDKTGERVVTEREGIEHFGHVKGLTKTGKVDVRWDIKYPGTQVGWDNESLEIDADYYLNQDVKEESLKKMNKNGPFKGMRIKHEAGGIEYFGEVTGVMVRSRKDYSEYTLLNISWDQDFPRSPIAPRQLDVVNEKTN